MRERVVATVCASMGALTADANERAKKSVPARAQGRGCESLYMIIVCARVYFTSFAPAWARAVVDALGSGTVVSRLCQHSHNGCECARAFLVTCVAWAQRF